VKESCDLWNEYKNVTLISKKLSISNVCVLNYLKQGLELSWCDYSPTRKIVQLSLDGEFIRKWNSMNEAENYLGITKHKISAVCSGKRKTTGGYRWMYKEDYEKMKGDIIPFAGQRYNTKEVIQLTLNNDYIKEWQSVTEAQKDLSVSNITSACKGKYKTAGGFKWMYKEDFDRYIENDCLNLV
jgi:hypothetical protein